MFSCFVLLNVVLMSDVCIVIVEYSISSIYVVYRLFDTSIINPESCKPTRACFVYFIQHHVSSPLHMAPNNYSNFSIYGHRGQCPNVFLARR